MSQSDEMLVDLSAMYAEALGMLPVLRTAAVQAGKDPDLLVLELRDAAGTLLLSVPFGDLDAQTGPRS